MKALDMLKTAVSVEKLATTFVKGTQRELQRSVLDKLQDRLDKITLDKFNLSNFILETDNNAGQRAMTSTDVQQRFAQLLDLGYQEELLKQELKIKQQIFDSYFGEETSLEADAASEE